MALNHTGHNYLQGPKSDLGFALGTWPKMAFTSSLLLGPIRFVLLIRKRPEMVFTILKTGSTLI